MLYPIAIEKGSETEAFGVSFPDIESCFSAGDSFSEALTNAKEAIEFHLEGLSEAGILPPEASSVDDHVSKPEFKNYVWALVDIDLEPFMGKSSKINVTLPNLLTKLIDDYVTENSSYKSRSHFLQVAASHELKKIA